MNKALKINTPFILILIILLGSFLRLYQLGNESIWIDEAVGIENASKPFVPMIKAMTFQDFSPPLYFTLVHFWIKIFGKSEFVVRALSAIAGIVSILLMYKLGTVLFGEKEGILGAFIFAISLKPPIWESQEARMYALFLLVVLISSILFIKAIKLGESLIPKKLISITIINILLVYIHIYGLFFIVFEAIYILLLKKKELKKWVMSFLIVFICYIPWLFVIIKLQLPTIKTQIFEGAGSLWLKKIGPMELYYIIWSLSSEHKILVIAFLGLSLFSILSSFRESIKNKQSCLLCFLWIITPIAISYILYYLLKKPFLRPCYLIFVIPAYYLLISKGVFAFRNKIIQLLLILSITGISGYILFSYYTTVEKEQWRESVKFVETSELKANAIVLSGGIEPFRYYYKKNIPVECFPFAISTAKGSIIADGIKNRIDNMQSIWFFKSVYNNPELEFEEWLNEKFCIKKEKEFMKIKVCYYSRK
ncbi:MAG: glycosyltransferase family 39 protein [bacterium]